MEKSIEITPHLLPLRPGATHAERVDRNRRMLWRALNLNTTIAFVGSGVSRAFGYPAWDEFARGVVDCTAEALQGTPALADLNSLRTGLQDPQRALDQNDLMFLIGACKRMLIENHLEDKYYEYLKTYFARGTRPPIDPFGPLLDLPIWRFATSNYDVEIERALVRNRFLPPADFGLDSDLESLGPCPVGCKGSFTQKSLHQLALFSLAGVAGNENMVFHCHGRFDDPESIIATEEDYQRWYLGEGRNDASIAFQQTIRLVLGSNPVLFLGYGLRDEDLLRPLRQLVTLEPGRKGSRPIFALLPESDDPADQYHHDGLFDRFGLHVIPFRTVDENGRRQPLTRALYEALKQLGDERCEARNEESRKPKVVKAEAATKKPHTHLEIQLVGKVRAHPLPELQAALHHPGVVVLVGPSGAGKSCQILELLESAERCGDDEEAFEGTFYWNAHYANETVVGIDRALSYFDPRGALRGTRFERIRECLRGHRHLLIVDGCERLLRPGEVPGTGWAYSPNFRRCLRAFADRQSRSTVVLVGRLWPADLDDLLGEAHGRPIVRRLDVDRLSFRRLRAIPPFDGLPEGDISALCSLLHGHQFGLDLACRYLLGHPGESELLQLNERLSRKLPDQRLREIFRLVRDALDVRHGRRGITCEFLERLGFFLNPVCRTTLLRCYEQAWKSLPPEAPGQPAALPSPDELEREAESLYCELTKAGLLLPMQAGAGEPGVAGSCPVEAYALHSTVRPLLFQPEHGLAGDPLPAVGLSGFTSGRLGVAPDRARCRQIRDLFDQLTHAAEACSAAETTHDARQLCRDAFGLLRTRMEANTVPGWTDYEKYLQFGIRLAKLTKQVTRGTWTFCEHEDAARFTESLEAVLYPAELAWLYNDTAMALSGSGYVQDACALFQQVFEVSEVVEDPREAGGFHEEVLLSLAFNFVEMGRLPAARRYMEDAEALLHKFPDDDLLARIQGIRGLMEHLGGNRQSACDLYDACLDRLRRGKNLRAQSLYLKHKADVMISMGESRQADLLIRQSRSLAEAGNFPELVANARLSEGHFLFGERDVVGARMEYDAVLHAAQRMKAHKLEARALTALARLALDQKDTEGAHKNAIQSLSLANELGLGLQQTHSLTVLGLISIEEGQTDLGVAYLRHAKLLADRQEYWTRSHEAEDKLLELQIEPDGSEYPPRPVTRTKRQPAAPGARSSNSPRRR